MDATVGHELGQGHAGDFAADRVEGADDDRLGRVVDDQVHSGGLLEGPNVAPFAADDAALHLVVGEMDRADGVLGGVVRGDALHRREDDLAGPILSLVAGRPLDGLADPNAVALGLVADRFEELGLGIFGTHAADPLQGRHVLKLFLGELLAGNLVLAFAIQQLAVALLEHVRPEIELLVSGQQTAFESGKLGPLGASLVLGFALQAHLLVFGFENQFLLLGARLGDDSIVLVLGALDGLIGDLTAKQEANDHAHHKGGHNGRGHKGGFHMNLPPIRPMSRPEVSGFHLGGYAGLGSDLPGPARAAALSVIRADAGMRRARGGV